MLQLVVNVTVMVKPAALPLPVPSLRAANAIERTAQEFQTMWSLWRGRLLQEQEL